MQLEVIRCPDRHFRPYVERAIEYYGQYLIPSKRLRDNIHLKIRFNSKLNVWAFASIVEFNASNKPREFLIEIHPWIGAKEILRTLAHEMVHIKQYVKGETNDTLSKWKGVPIDPDTIDYYHHPWEMEAYSIETGLFTKFVVKEQLWNVFEEIGNPDSQIIEENIKWKNVKNN